MERSRIKIQTEFTFEQAKKAASERLAMLVSLTESLHQAFQDQALLEWSEILQKIKAKVDTSSTRCLAESEIKHVHDFAQELTRCNPQLSRQLTQFWSLYHSVFRVLRSRRKNCGYSLRGWIDRLGSRISLADALAEDIVSSACEQISSILSPTALLLIHIVRTETIEYALKRQLGDAIKKHSLKEQYDVEAMCSVEGKVKKDGGWQTDVRAVRDAASHGKFGIKLVDNEWQIEFHNNMHGYSFHKIFSRIEFNRFFDLHTMLYKLQLHLLTILELLSILTTHFLESGSTPIVRAQSGFFS